MANRTYGQFGGLAAALELIGERWALLIVRDLLVGPRRYTDLKQGLPKIPTNILATRLKELGEGGVVRRVPIARCGLVYELTEYGRALEPALLALGRWGSEASARTETTEVVTPDALAMELRTAFRADKPEGPDQLDVTLTLADITMRVIVSGTDVELYQLAPEPPPTASAPPAGESPVVIRADAIADLLDGVDFARAAVGNGSVTLVAGSADDVAQFARVFTLQAEAAVEPSAV